ncbi:hypothetical protein OAQ99_03030 [Candidatus Kapabacteria bacterium]|nr:hypothetical protein [Candidatus Kapabacteria bacterium]
MVDSYWVGDYDGTSTIQPSGHEVFTISTYSETGGGTSNSSLSNGGGNIHGTSTSGGGGYNRGSID